ncbi:hypothetical protein [Bradyrhizobium ottawaense]|uniref:hypothetical protein n=1 Tax=Bradyrhizobium ottawaense TaxID=931866 RepID=UPI0012603EEF|nr:hypothetical protein [Bradyrhizobium ottawaense]
MNGKLDDIQKKLTEVLVTLDGLPSEVDRLLLNNNSRVLHTRVGGVIAGYSQVLNDRPHYPTEAAWRSSTSYADCRALIERLQSARQEINWLNLVDPVTAMVATQAFLVEQGLMLSLGYAGWQLRANCELYDKWFSSMIDPSVTGSITNYTANAVTRLSQLQEQASKEHVGALLAFKANESWERETYLCTGVNDVTPAHEEWVDEDCPPIEHGTHGGGGLSLHDEAIENLARVGVHVRERTRIDQFIIDRPSDSNMSAIGDDLRGKLNTYFSSFDQNSGLLRVCRRTVGVPEQSREKYRWLKRVHLRLEEVRQDGKGTGLMVYAISTDPPNVVSNTVASAYPDWLSRCSADLVVRADVRTQAGATSYLNDAAQTTQLLQWLDEFSLSLQKINQERAKIALGFQAAAAVGAAKLNINELLKIYR